jgi:hypothetical protein
MAEDRILEIHTFRHTSLSRGVQRLAALSSMVKHIRFELTQANANRFTVCPGSPTPAVQHNLETRTGVEPVFTVLQAVAFTVQPTCHGGPIENRTLVCCLQNSCITTML